MNNTHREKVGTTGRSTLACVLVAVLAFVAGAVGLMPIGGLATPLQPDALGEPRSVAVGPNGSLYVADTGHHRVLRIDNPRAVAEVAIIVNVSGRPGSSGDGGPALRARLRSPSGLAVDARGNLYIADTDNHRIRVVNRDGLIRTVAGTGFRDFSGDGGPAADADLDSPLGVAVAPFGLLIADSGNDRVRLVNEFGRIRTVAGGGELGDGVSDGVGDGLPATEASLNMPSDVAVLGDEFFIADTGHHRIRHVAGDVIETVAGNGIIGFDGDGGLAPLASLFFPRGIDAGGGRGIALFIADTLNHRIRRVGLDVVIDTIAGIGPIGRGRGGCSGDVGDPAKRSRFNEPWGVAVDEQSNLFIADTGNNRILWVDARGVIRGVLGSCR